MPERNEYVPRGVIKPALDAFALQLRGLEIMHQRFAEHIYEERPMVIPPARATIHISREDIIDDSLPWDELSDEERRLLEAFRRFRARNSNGVFRWRMLPCTELIKLPQPSLIIDPQEVTDGPGTE